MAEGAISDAEIAAMSHAQRRELMQRLERPLDDLVPAAALSRARRIRLVLMVGAVIGLIPWIGYLALTLPEKYVAHNWTVTWVGFDVLLFGFLTATAVLALLRRQLLILTAFTSGVLLISDAWFDVITAAPIDRWSSVSVAVVVEVPLALVLITGALRILRLTVTRWYLLDPGQPLWQVPLLP
jgi:hypothetical protein